MKEEEEGGGQVKGCPEKEYSDGQARGENKIRPKPVFKVFAKNERGYRLTTKIIAIDRY